MVMYMELIRTWIMQVAGIIALGAACDMIMPEGEIKKYVKMVVGFVLVFTIIKPAVNIVPEAFAIAIPQGTRAQAVELKNNFDERQQETILRIYKDKIEDSIENEVYSGFGVEATAKIEVEEDDEMTFGNITKLKLRIGKNTNIAEEKLNKTLMEKFEIKEQDIDIERK